MKSLIYVIIAVFLIACSSQDGNKNGQQEEVFKTDIATSFFTIADHYSYKRVYKVGKEDREQLVIVLSNYEQEQKGENMSMPSNENDSLFMIVLNTVDNIQKGDYPKGSVFSDSITSSYGIWFYNNGLQYRKAKNPKASVKIVQLKENTVQLNIGYVEEEYIKGNLETPLVK